VNTFFHFTILYVVMLYVHYTGCKFTNKFAARQSFMCFFSEMVSWQEGIGC